MATLQPGFASIATADPVSPLAVTKTANPSPVTSGGQLTYTITITNTGGAKVDTVVMTDQVNGVGTIQSPPGLPQLTITSTQGLCSQGGPDGNVVTCQIGTIKGGATVTITIRGQVTAANGTTLNNTASVSGTKSAQNFTTNASVQVLVQGTSGGGTAPDLTLNKTGPTSVATGANVDYVLTVNNLGNANTSDVKVVDTLPVGVTLQSPPSATIPFETTSLFSCSSSGSPITVTCIGGTVNAGQNATIKIHAVAPGTAGQITNTAIVDPDQQIAESNELNNASATVYTDVTTAPPPQGLTIVKTDGNPDLGVAWATGAGPDPVTPGQVLTYKIQVTNTATTRADDVVITDGTQSLEASSIVASQVVANGTIGNFGGCFINAPQVMCKVRTLNPGGTITLTIQGLVVSTAGASIFNTATVTGNIKNQGVQAASSESTTVRPAVDLSITKSDSPDPVCARSWPTTANPSADHLAMDGGSPAAAGDIPAIGLLAPPVCLGGLTYTFVVGNSGITDATNVAIRDQLAPGVIFDSYDTTGGFSCSVNASNVVSCTGGTVPAASTVQIRFRVVAPNTLGTLSNSVTVDPNNAIFEPDETNNDATTTTDVRTGIDLVVWKDDNKNDDPPGGAPPLAEGFDPIATSGTGTYTIIVDNVGTQDATNIKVVDTLPAGTKFLSVTADQGFTCGHNGAATGGIVTCIAGHLVGTESEFYDPAGATGPTTGHDEFATIKIKFFATPFVQQVGQTMHNEVRVDPDNTINEANELNNLATDDTVVTTGNDDIGAFNQLTIDKTQTSPASNGAVATNGILEYNLHVENKGTDPVSNVEVQDFLPAGSRFISATDITVAGPSSAKFFCAHDGSATGGTVACIGGDFSGSLNIIAGPPPVPTARDIKIRIFAPNTPQTAVNTGTVDPNDLVPEGNEFDNDDQQDPTVSPCVGQANCTAQNAVYELTILKEQNRSPIARNGLETYTLTISNLGSDSISGVTVKDFLPAGTRFFDARDTSVPTDPSRFSCSYDGAPTGGTVTCVGGVLDGTADTLGAGVPQSRQIQIRAFMPDTPGTYTNRSVVDPANAIPEGNEFNNESDIDTDVQNGGPNPWIDLQVDKTQDAVLDQDTPGGVGTPVRVDTGQGIVYMLHVTNSGEADAFNVSVRDVLPAGVTFFSAADAVTGTGQFTCTFSAPNVDCSGGTIPAAGSRDIKIVVVAPTDLDQIASDPGAIKQTITNQAFVDPFNAIGEGDESNNQDTIQTIVESQVNLTIDKKGPTSASQNETTEYKITVTNNLTWGDGRTVFGVKVIDPLPVGLIPIGSVEAGGNFTCQVQENPVNTVTCVGDLTAGQSVDITVHVFITADGGTLDNEACVDPDHVIDETSELDNCKTAITGVTPAVADLAINKTADKGTVTAGDTLTYTVAVINQGTADASGTITMTDMLPGEVTFVNTNPDAGWTCSESSGTVTCTRTGLSAGATSNIKIVTTVNSGATGSFDNTASVNGNGQSPDPTATVTTNVGGSPIDLVLSGLSDNPDPANVGQNITYTFAVSNGGTSPSGAFDITAKMDTGALSGLAFVGASASQGFICGDISTDTVTCTGSLPAGQSTNVTIEFQVLASSPTTHTLDVKVDPTNAIAESTDANNDDTETTTVTGSLCTNCIDLVAGGFLVTPDPAVSGASLTRIATVSNAGDISTATAGTDAAKVWVYFDGGSETFVSASATGGFTCTSDALTFAPYVVIECVGDLGPGAGVAVTVNTTVTASGGSTIEATVVADPLDELTQFTTANDFVIEDTNVVDP